jgi:hypothetical protein
LSAPPPADPDRANQRQELEMLKERLEWEKRMVQKGFLAESQVEKTRLEVVRADAALAKAEAPKTPDPRRAVLEAAVTHYEDVVQRCREAVARGIIPMSELANAEFALHEFKLKLLELPDRPADARARAAAEREAMIALKEHELAQAESSALRRRVVSPEEMAQLRVDVGRLKAEAATAAGDYAAAVKHREGVVAEFEALAALARARVERKSAPRAELRAAEVALAEARAEALKAGVRRQLAEIVALREAELKEARALADAKAITAENLRQVELAVAEAKARLAAER